MMSGFISRIVQSVTGNKARLSALERDVRRLLRASEESALIGDGFAGAGALLHSLAGQQDVLVFEITGNPLTGSGLQHAVRLQAYTPGDPYGLPILGTDSEDDTYAYYVMGAPGEPVMWVGCRGVAVHSNSFTFTAPGIPGTFHASAYITIRSEASGFQAYILGAPVNAKDGIYRWARTPDGDDEGYCWARDMITRDGYIIERNVFPPDTPIWLRWNGHEANAMRKWWFSGFAEPHYGICEE